MKRKSLLMLIVLFAALVGMADIGFRVQYAVKNFPQVVVLNTDTGCTANYFEPPGVWRVFDAADVLVFEGSEGPAMNALLFLCP